MNTGKTIFAQLTEHLPLNDFHLCVQTYQGNYKVKSFSCLDQFLCMAFAQLTYRESLRDIEACLRAHNSKLYHMGIRGKVSRNTLANANLQRDWRIYADFAQTLILIARSLYIDEDFGIELKQTAYALDATVIDLCLATFPWAKFRKQKGAIKLHTLLDLKGSIPAFIHISDGKLHDVNAPRFASPRSRSFLHHGSRLCRFRASLPYPQAFSIFSYPSKIKQQLNTNILFEDRQNSRTTLRPNYQTQELLRGKRLSRVYSPHQIPRQRNRSDLKLSDQQSHLTSPYDYRTLSLSLESRTVLQMDQATSAYQSILRNFRECSKVTDLDCNLDLCASRYCQKKIKTHSQSLYDFTNSEFDAFRENAHPATVCWRFEKYSKQRTRQPVDFIQLTLGH